MELNSGDEIPEISPVITTGIRLRKRTSGSLSPFNETPPKRGRILWIPEWTFKFGNVLFLYEHFLMNRIYVEYECFNFMMIFLHFICEIIRIFTRFLIFIVCS